MIVHAPLNAYLKYLTLYGFKLIVLQNCQLKSRQRGMLSKWNDYFAKNKKTNYEQQWATNNLHTWVYQSNQSRHDIWLLVFGRNLQLSLKWWTFTWKSRLSIPTKFMWQQIRDCVNVCVCVRAALPQMHTYWHFISALMKAFCGTVLWPVLLTICFNAVFITMTRCLWWCWCWWWYFPVGTPSQTLSGN